MATLYVGNLIPACNEDMIGRSFVRFGDIQKSKSIFMLYYIGLVREKTASFHWKAILITVCILKQKIYHTVFL